MITYLSYAARSLRAEFRRHLSQSLDSAKAVIHAKGELVHSYAMLTLSAAGHLLMERYHKPDDEKRMLVIIPNGSSKEWLRRTVTQILWK